MLLRPEDAEEGAVANPSLDDLVLATEYGDNYHNYIPSQEAIEYYQLNNQIYGDELENVTPIMHFKMFDALHSGKDICIVAHRGSGKALDLDEVVYTEHGEVKVRDVKLGDMIFDREGKLVKVVSLSRIYNTDTYKMTFAENREVICCKDHLWITECKVKRVKGEHIIPTERIAKNYVAITKEENRKSPNTKSREYIYKVNNTKPLMYSSKKCNIPVETFLQFFTTKDLDANTFIHLRELDGMTPSTLREKQFIPHIYKYNSIEIREKILEFFKIWYVKEQNRMRIASKQLAIDLVDISRSLGRNAKYNTDVKTRKGLVPYLVYVDLRPYKKKATVLNVEKIENRPTKCITVRNKDHSFLTSGHIPTHNSTSMGQNLFFYVAIMRELPRIGVVRYAIYVSDTVKNGCKTMTSNMTYTYENSEFLQKMIPKAKFTEALWELTNVNGEMLSVRVYGAEALSLDTILFGEHNDTTIKDCKVGDKIYGADGKLATIIRKSEIFNKPMYRIELEDGRTLKVSEDHINSVYVKERVYKPKDMNVYTPKDLYTRELLTMPLIKKRDRQIFIKASEPIERKRIALPIDPYTLGLLLGDGSFRLNSGSARLVAHIDDWEHYEQLIPYKMGRIERKGNTYTRCLLGVYRHIHSLGLDQGSKFIPELYFYGSIEQRLALLRGLIDTDGHIGKNGRMDFSSHNATLMQDFVRLARSLGMVCKVRETTKKLNGKTFTGQRCEIWTDVCPATLPRKVVRFKKSRFKPFVAIKSITRIEDEPSQCIAIDNEDHQFIVNDYVRTHNSGIRGGREQNTRPNLAVIDDVLSDKSAKSETKLETVKDTIFKAIEEAMHPVSLQIIIGTPFHAKCVVSEAVESGNYTNIVFPICEKFPCTKEEFRGVWEERFPYSVVNRKYQKAKNNKGKNTLQGFYQELMLMPTASDRQMIDIANIKYWDYHSIMENTDRFHFYLTTDFATSEKQSADLSYFLVWAIDDNYNHIIVDGWCGKQLMDKNVDKMFYFVDKYPILQAGVEVNGQQGGFIPLIKREMTIRKKYFKLATSNLKENLDPETNSSEGIKSQGTKLQRFSMVYPLLANNQIGLIEQHKSEPYQIELLHEFSKVTPDSVENAKYDDGIDCFSQIQYIPITLPHYIVSSTLFGSSNKLANDERNRSVYKNTSLNNVLQKVTKKRYVV